mgnify:CR=1 FL=1
MTPFVAALRHLIISVHAARKFYVLEVRAFNNVGDAAPASDLEPIKSVYGVNGMSTLASAFVWQPLTRETSPWIRKVIIQNSTILTVHLVVKATPVERFGGIEKYIFTARTATSTGGVDMGTWELPAKAIATALERSSKGNFSLRNGGECCVDLELHDIEPTARMKRNGTDLATLFEASFTVGVKVSDCDDAA